MRTVEQLFTKRVIIFRVLQVCLFFGGVFCFAWAHFAPRFRGPEGFVNGQFCLPISVGVAMIILGFALTGKLRKFACWFVLALVGQAVTLQIIEAGPHAQQQHYIARPLSRLLTEDHPFLVIYLSMQTAFVLAGMRHRWAEIRAWFANNFKSWKLLGAGFLFFLSSATLSRHIDDYLSELFLASLLQTINLGNIVLVVWTLPEAFLLSVRKTFNRWLFYKKEGDAAGACHIDRFVILAAIWVTALTAFFSFYLYERHPHIPDEVAYIYHARYFAQGMLTMPLPSVPEAFRIFLMDFENSHWFSVQLPGWPAMLALGMALGTPWLINPVLAGLNLLLSYFLLLDTYDRRTARMAVLLLCFSPWYIFMAMNFMTHTFTLTCAITAALSVVMARKTDKALWGWISGLAVGMVSLIRPLEALAIGGLIGLWVIGVGGVRLKSSAILGFVLGVSAVASLGFLYNYLLTGTPTTFPFSAYADKHFGIGSNALGFGPERGLGWSTLDPRPGHDPLDALINVLINLNLVNIELFGWSTGSLFLLTLMLFSGASRRNEYIMLSVIGLIIFVHVFYWFSGGPDFGARYWYLIIFPCVALTVRGSHHLVRTLEHGPHFVPIIGMRVMAGVILLSLLSILNFFPWRAIDKYHHYRGFRPDIRELASKYSFGRDFILIRGNNYNDYPSAAVYNPIDLNDNRPIYAWDASPEIREKLLKSFSDRKVWLVNAPSITHKGFEVIRGPISNTELLAQGEKDPPKAPSGKTESSSRR